MINKHQLYCTHKSKRKQMIDFIALKFKICYEKAISDEYHVASLSCKQLLLLQKYFQWDGNKKWDCLCDGAVGF